MSEVIEFPPTAGRLAYEAHVRSRADLDLPHRSWDELPPSARQCWEIAALTAGQE